MQISNDILTLELAPRGGELRSIRTADGAQWLWQGDPAWWSGRSPLLFPVVGKSPNDMVTIAGTPYPMPSHGIARINDFVVAESSPGSARLVLQAGDETRANYPFSFRLDITYTLERNRIGVTATVLNRDETDMPVQFGFHPAFAWPLPDSSGKSHVVQLANDGEPPLYRLDADNLLIRTPHPSPFTAGHFRPDPQHFDEGAMIFVGGAGSHVSFFAEGGARIDMATANLPNFALWQKPGAPFLCLEPWHGTAPWNDQGNALENRNGVLVLAPGASETFHMDLTITPAGR